MNERKSENGQALVLVILAIVGLFGFAALAVDVGQVYAARRNAQSAADAAALAAGYDAIAGVVNHSAAIDAHPESVKKGYALAASNGFDNGGDELASTHPDVRVSEVKFKQGVKDNLVIINNPPNGGGPYCGACAGDVDYNRYFQVKITIRLHPIFAQMIYKGAQVVTVESIAKIKDSETVSAGTALHALSNACGGPNNAMVFDGTTALEVNGGKIFSNGCWTKDGNAGKIRTIVTEENGWTHTLEHGIQAGKTQSCNGCGGTNSSDATVWPPVEENQKEQKVTGMQTPFCPATDSTINGVNYYVHNSGITGTVTLPKGIHCVKGDIQNANVSGTGVLVVLLDGGIRQDGGSKVNLDLRAAQSLIDKNDNEWGGMVLYAPQGNASTITFGGNTDAYFYGTIYAPGATCDMGGATNGAAYHSAVVCNQVKLHGTPKVTIYYNQDELWHGKPTVELIQ